MYNQSHDYVLSNQKYDSSNGGYAIVNGTSERDYISSSSYVSDTLTINVSINFNNWIIQNTESGFIKINGTVNYYRYKSSQTTSNSYSSSLTKTIKNGAGQKVDVEYNIKYGSNIKDSILIDVVDKNNNDFMVTGTVTGSKGTFTF